MAEQLRQFEASYIVADETAIVSHQLHLLLEEVNMGGKQVHDANIVATMKACGVNTLLTMNGRDFERFAAWISIISPITLAERAG